MKLNSKKIEQTGEMVWGKHNSIGSNTDAELVIFSSELDGKTEFLLEIKNVQNNWRKEQQEQSVYELELAV